MIVGFGHHAKYRVLPAVNDLFSDIIVVSDRDWLTDPGVLHMTRSEARSRLDSSKDLGRWIVYVACESPTHLAVVSEFADFGVVVLCEKPFGVSSVSLKEFCRANAFRDIYQVNMYRFSTSFRLFFSELQHLRNTSRGFIKHQLVFCMPRLERKSFRDRSGFGSSILLDAGWYLLDLIISIVRGPLELHSVEVTNDCWSFLIKSDNQQYQCKVGYSEEYINSWSYVCDGVFYELDLVFGSREGFRKVVLGERSFELSASDGFRALFGALQSDPITDKELHMLSDGSVMILRILEDIWSLGNGRGFWEPVTYSFSR